VEEKKKQKSICRTALTHHEGVDLRSTASEHHLMML